MGAALQPVATSHNLLLKLQLPTACCCWLPRGWSLLKKRRESRNWEYSQAHLLMKAYGIQDIVIHVVIGNGVHIFMVPLILLGKFWNCSIVMGHKHLPEVYSKYRNMNNSLWLHTYIYVHTQSHQARQFYIFFIIITKLESKLHLNCSKSRIVNEICNWEVQNQMQGPETFPGYLGMHMNWEETSWIRLSMCPCVASELD